MNESEYNRNESYLDLVKSKNLSETQEAVLRFIFHSPDCTDNEISAGTGLTLNCVNGRRNELVHEGLIKSSGSKVNQCTGNVNTTWRFCEGDIIPKELEDLKLSSSEFDKLQKLIYKANDFQKNKIKEMLE